MESQIMYLEEKYEIEKAIREEKEVELKQWQMKSRNILEMANSNRLLKMNKSLVEMNDQILRKYKIIEDTNKLCHSENRALQAILDNHQALFG